MESIRVWLNGKRDYKAGVKLYLLFGKDKLLRRLFSDPDKSDFKTKKLSEVLTALLSSTTDKKEDVKQAAEMLSEKLQSEAAPESGWSDNQDEVEASLYSNWKPLFVEMMDLCSRVGDVSRSGNEKEAGRMALRILELDDQCDALYQERDHYKAKGMLPDQRPYGEPCIDPKLIPRALENAQRYVRQYKNKLKKDPQDVKAAAQLKKYEWFVDHYKKELNIA